MAAMNEHEEFLLSYWSDLQLAGKDNGNRSSVGIDVSVESPKDKSERLRKLIKFISGIRYRCSLTKASTTFRKLLCSVPCWRWMFFITPYHAFLSTW